MARDGSATARAGVNAERLAGQLPAFLPLPWTSFDPSRVVVSRVNSLSLVRFDTNNYSAPVRYAYQRVTPRAGTEAIRTDCDGQRIAEHRRQWGRHRTVFDWVHYLGLALVVYEERTGEELHMDCVDLGPSAPYRAVTVLGLIDAFTEENGATRVVPGSHLARRPPPKGFADPASRHPDQVVVTASAGSVLVFNGHLWHSGTRNRSGGHRRAVQCSFGAESIPGPSPSGQ